MASLMEEIADALARDTLRVVEETGDEDLIALVGRTIGASSTTTQEAYLTAVRVRIAEERARRLLAERADDDWPLRPFAPGGGAVVVAGAVPALAPPPPRMPRRASVFDGPPLPPDEPMPGHEPVLEEEDVEPELEEPEPLAEEPAAPPPEPEPPPDDGRIRPRRPGERIREPAAVAPMSIEVALALATSLPRKPLAEVEAPKVDPLYPDVEIPDGDFG